MEISVWHISAIVSVIVVLVTAGIWIGRVSTKIKHFDRTFKEINDAIRNISENIIRIFERLPARSVKSQGPVRLTEFGEKISKQVDANNWANENKENLIDKLEGKEEFEIYDLCKIYIDEIFDKSSEFKRLVKSSAYQMGTDEGNVLNVYYVVLRDVLLSKKWIIMTENANVIPHSPSNSLNSLSWL